jgi:hypothetical protein
LDCGLRRIKNKVCNFSILVIRGLYQSENLVQENKRIEPLSSEASMAFGLMKARDKLQFKMLALWNSFDKEFFA